MKSIFAAKVGDGSSSGLGLLNVRKRLELYYGSNLININSNYGQGIEVTIRIPIIKRRK